MDIQEVTVSEGANVSDYRGSAAWLISFNFELTR